MFSKKFVCKIMKSVRSKTFMGIEKHTIEDYHIRIFVLPFREQSSEQTGYDKHNGDCNNYTYRNDNVEVNHYSKVFS